MIYYEDLKILDPEYMKRVWKKSCSDRFVARECEDGNGTYWRLLAVVSHENNGFAYRETVLMCDTFEELAIWSYLYNVKIHHKEPLPLLS